MATTWKLRDYLHERRIKPAALAKKMDGKMSRTAVYGLVQLEQPKAVYLETLNAVLPALRELTGKEVTPNDLLEFTPDPEPVEGMDAETRAWMDAELAPPLEPYEWGDVDPETLGQGRVKYVKGQGWVVTGEHAE